MRAVVLRSGHLLVAEVPEPELGPGKLLVQPIAAGICGSDLSAREHTDEFLQFHRDIGALGSVFDPQQDLVMGHEFTARVLEVGAGVADYAPGDLLVTLPHAVDDDGVQHTVGYSSRFPGALGERVVVEASGHLKIPEGVSPYLAAITEPMATGVNGVLRSRIEVPAGAIVTGCGPVGLGSVVELAHRGTSPIVASDPSPARRSAAVELGADAVVDPSETDPVDAWRDLADRTAPLYVFEASGRPGILNTLLYALPSFSRIFVVGACMVDDVIRPVVGVTKNIGIEFVGGPGRGEASYHAFAATFRHIVRGHFDPRAVVTGYTGLEGVPQAFELLRPKDPHAIEHVKILIRPDLATAEVQVPR